jgi:hypothetical protein
LKKLLILLKTAAKSICALNSDDQELVFTVPSAPILRIAPRDHIKSSHFRIPDSIPIGHKSRFPPLFSKDSAYAQLTRIAVRSLGKVQ